VFASGAGAAARRAIGAAVFWGMMAATFFGIVLVPALYVLFQTLRAKGHRIRAGKAGLHLLLLLLVPMFMNGCMSVGPDYAEPDWKDTGIKPDASLDAQTLGQWWNTLNDPQLVELVNEALQNNPNLKSSVAAVRGARARLGMARSAYGPQIDAAGGYARQKTSDATTGGLGGERDLYSGGFDASWEIDLFGGTRRSVEAAVAALEAQEADYADVRVSLAAETAQSYVQLRTYQKQLEVANANLALQQQTLELLQSRFAAGLSDDLAVQQARYNLEGTRATIPVFETQVERSLNALAVLTGQMPGSLHERLGAPSAIPAPGVRTVTGIPADSLRRRPDVRRSERQLAEQTARIGVATADLYPRFTLNGSIGIESLSASTFGDSGTDFYSIGPGVSWALFHSGSIRNRIKAQEAVQEQYLAAYENTVLQAVQETRDALAAFANEQRRLESLSSAVEAARTASERAGDQYKNGLVNFDTVLNAQRALLSYESQLAQSRGGITQDLIQLYKALGGGWQETVE
ncbi:MAG: efflux transporter outer membrane subunit, partial [Kiritimatiellales bacterium]|nr:efflux transporter outer membrane subunit [Kiritimatiellales bacterium]